MIANIIGLGMSFLCGVFVPQNMLSPGLLSFAKFLPAYWYTRVNDMLGGLSNESVNLQFVMTAFGIQLLFAATLFAAALATTKIKQRQ
jgi:ABC-2 type transport system permease protein